ncbi:MAG TPA: alpha/beta hydrolase [Terriglobales bacterium]|jgi:pimeloyl-ACP methyl ester carboxylesterase|nr:alpha/beta hydrolase [Terriglobales bacterium]
MIDSLEAPPSSGVLREARGLIELPRLLLRFPDLRRQPRGNGEPVLILPGYGAGDGSTAILKVYLRYLGYRARGWGLGRNIGTVEDLLPRILKRLASLARRTHQEVRVIGWSFGGYLARELARERPDLVRQVITLGTPVIGGPKYTVVAERYRRRGIDIEAIAAQVECRNQISLCTPVVAIYSRVDGFVAWQACIDRNAANVEHIEVRTTHIGFGFSPDVYKIIAQRLSNRESTEPSASARSRPTLALRLTRRKRRR